MFENSLDFIEYMGWETLASSLIEKARYCSMIPRDQADPLSLYNECLKQLDFLQWLKAEPKAPQIVKDYVNQITFEKNYDQYVLPFLRKLSCNEYIRESFYDTGDEDIAGEEIYVMSTESVLSAKRKFDSFLENDILLNFLRNPNINQKAYNIQTICHKRGTPSSQYDHISLLRVFHGIRDEFFNLGLSTGRQYVVFNFDISGLDPTRGLKEPIRFKIQMDIFCWRDTDTPVEIGVNIIYSLPNKTLKEIYTKLGQVIQTL